MLTILILPVNFSEMGDRFQLQRSHFLSEIFQQEARFLDNFSTAQNLGRRKG